MRMHRLEKREQADHRSEGISKRVRTYKVPKSRLLVLAHIIIQIAILAEFYKYQR